MYRGAGTEVKATIGDAFHTSNTDPRMSATDYLAFNAHGSSWWTKMACAGVTLTWLLSYEEKLYNIW